MAATETQEPRKTFPGASTPDADRIHRIVAAGNTGWAIIALFDLLAAHKLSTEEQLRDLSDAVCRIEARIEAVLAQRGESDGQ